MNFTCKGDIIVKVAYENNERIYNNYIVDNTPLVILNTSNLNANNIIQLSKNKLFSSTNEIVFMTEYNDNYIIIYKLCKRDKYYDQYITLCILDKQLNIINQIDIYYDGLGPFSNKRFRNFQLYRNYIIFHTCSFYKINLDTLEITESEPKYSNDRSVYNDFAIHKKNNCIYFPSADYTDTYKPDDFFIYVINIKTLNTIKKIYICDKEDWFLEHTLTSMWCIIQNNKLIINTQFDNSGGCTSFIKLENLDNKNVPDTCSIKQYPSFIDSGDYFIYKKYIYIPQEGIVYNIATNQFIAIQNIQKIIEKCDTHVCIHKNYYITFINNTIAIIDLDKHPLLEKIDYRITVDISIPLTCNYNAIFLIHNKILSILDTKNKLFFQYKLDNYCA